MRGAWVVAWILALLGALSSVARLAAAQQQEGGEAAPQGTIAGRVLDKSTGDPIIEAGIEVMQTGKRLRTDLDGKYSIKLPPGEYSLRIFAPLYQGARIEKVVVRPNQVAQTDASLAPEGQAGVEVVEVVAQADKATEATQLLERKKSAVVSDNISAQTIATSPDRNAAEIIKRVPAVTIQNNRFVFVRGLGERYSSAMLDGSRLPSTDPNRRVVPLDLFPSEFIQSMNVMKSYSPDLPGDFSGGLIDIRLKEFPEQLTYTIGTSTGGNTNATFQNFGTYHGGPVDYLGLGAPARSLGSGVPSNLSSRNVPPAQQQAYASQFQNVWSTQSMTAPPNYSLNFSVGDSWGPLGVNLGGIYSTQYQERRDEFQENFTVKGTPPNVEINDELNETLTFNRSVFFTRLGGVLTAGYKLDPDNTFSLRAFVDHNSADQVIDGVGHDRNISDEINQWQLQYREEQLGFGQLGGNHHLSFGDVDWRSALSQSTATEPDTRFITYDLNPTPDISRHLFLAGEGPESSERLYSNLTEWCTDSAVNLTIPFKTSLPFTTLAPDVPGKLKLGPAYSFRKRDFDYRRFLYTRNSNGPAPEPGLFSQAPEAVLDPSNVGSLLSFEENTKPADSFTATQTIAAMYGMFDAQLVPDRWRLVAGVRVEYSYISTASSDISTNQANHAYVNDLSPLPGVNLIYSLREDMNVRAGYSQSVSRPEFRELTPTRFVVPNGERPVIGNQNLQSASIDSYDLRWEWFLSPTEILSAGFFYKTLSNPIEQTVIPESAGEANSFTNADNADLWGFEWEGRKNLGVLSPYLLNVNVLANVTYIDSTVTISPQAGQVQTSSSRALQGQAPFVVNAAVEYVHPTWGTARLLYNTLGNYITSAGTDGLPDIFQQQRNELDAAYLVKINPFGTPLTAKVGLENLTNEEFVQTQGDFTTHSYKTGVTMTFGLSYTY